MKKIILYSSLICIPFYEVICYLLPQKLIAFENTRIEKSTLALNMALIFSLMTIYETGFRPFKNKPILIFMGLCLFGISIAPNYTMIIGSMDLGGFWNWQAMSKYLIYFMFLLAVGSSTWNIFDRIHLSSILFWCGAAMSIYVILQYFGFDQFYGQLRKDNVDILAVTNPYLGGTLGQPTIVAPFIAMLLPFALKLKKYVYAALFVGAVILTGSKVAIVAGAVGILFYYLKFTKKRFICFLAVGILAGGVALTQLPKLGDSGRSGVWQQIVKDVRAPAFDKAGQNFALTGKGVGSYRYVFAPRYNTRFHQPHNFLLQILHDCGISGAIFVIMGLFCFFFSRIEVYKEYQTALLISILCALGTLTFHLGVFQFYTIVFAGVLLSHENTREYLKIQ